MFICRKGAIDFERGLQLVGAAIGSEIVSLLFGREFRALEEVTEKRGLPSIDQVFRQTRNPQKPDMPDGWTAQAFLPTGNARQRRVENHRPARGVRIMLDESESDLAAKVVADDVGTIEPQFVTQLLDIRGEIDGVITPVDGLGTTDPAQIDRNNGEVLGKLGHDRSIFEPVLRKA